MIRRPLCCFCLVCVMGIFLWLLVGKPPDADISAWIGRKILVCGTVGGKELRGETQVLYLNNVTFCDMESPARGDSFQLTNMNGKYGLVCYSSQDLPKMGAVVRMTGEIFEFSTASNPGEFDLRRYYLLQGYCGKLMDAELVGVSENYNVWKEGLYRMRCRLSAVLEQILKEEDASVMRTMLLGEKSRMDRSLRELYQASGIAHILAISGLHISIIGTGLYQCLKKLAVSQKACTGIALIVMICYVVMTGESTSAIRAVVMFGFMVMADVFKRSYDLPTALSVAAFCTAAAEPYVLLQPGYWMSYLAVFGVAVLYPSLVREVEIENKRRRAIWNALAGGISANLAILPVLLMSYYEYPVYSVLINLLVLPLMSVLLMAGLFSMAAGCIFLPLGKAAGMVVHMILCFYEWICNIAVKLPGQSWVTGAPGVGRVVVYYVILLFLAGSGHKFGKRKPYRLKPVTWLIFLMAAVLLMGIHTNNGLKMTFLDVGQGDGICIQTEAVTCMVDGGSSSKNRLAEYQLEPFLKHEGISEIDYWLITHPDQDHCSGFAELLKSGNKSGIVVRTLVLPDAYGAEEQCRELIDLAEANHIKVIFLSAGESIEAGRCRLTVLHPEEDYRAEDANAMSLVVSVEYGGFCGILTGDATAACEREVIRYWEENGFLPIQLLKVGHHGSSTSTSEIFLQYCNPRFAVISCGKDNSYGHPHQEVIDRLEKYGCEILTTMEDGAVSLWTDGERLEISKFR